MRHRDHGNTKGGKFTISIYNVYSLSEYRQGTYCSSHICDYVHTLPKSYLQLFTCAAKDVMDTEFPHALQRNNKS